MKLTLTLNLLARFLCESSFPCHALNIFFLKSIEYAAAIPFHLSFFLLLFSYIWAAFDLNLLYDINRDGNPTEPLPLDQRGFSRISEGSVDLGAVEVGDSDLGSIILESPISNQLTEEGSSTTTFKISRNTTSTAINVSLKLSVTATANDYSFYDKDNSSLTVTNNLLVVPLVVGQVSATVTVQANDDSAVEPKETLILKIDSIAPPPPIGNQEVPGLPFHVLDTVEEKIEIVDNEPVATIANGADGSEGGTNGSFTVKFDRQTSQPFTLYYGLSGTASKGSDFTVLDSIQVEVERNEVQIPITVSNDSIDEDDETVTLTLLPNLDPLDSTPSYYAIDNSNSQRTIKIVDNDTAGVTVTPTTGITTEKGGHPVFLTIDRLLEKSQKLLRLGADLTGF